MAARPAPIAHVVEDDAAVKAVINRLKRAQGQLGGAIAMLEDDRSCADIVTQLSAASKAVDRAAFTVVSCGLTACIQAEANGEEPPMARERLEKLFLSLA